MKRALTLAVIALALGAAQPRADSPGIIVISQVYGGGGNASAPYQRDFIELFNRGGAPVDVSGWGVQYAAAAGTTWSVTPLSGLIPAGGYLLVAESAGSGNGVPLPAADVSGTIAMASAAGKVALVSISTALAGACPSGAQIVDFVGFGLTA